MPLSKPRTSKVPQLPFIYPSNITSFLLSSSHKKNFFVVKQIKDDEKKKKDDERTACEGKGGKRQIQRTAK